MQDGSVRDRWNKLQLAEKRFSRLLGWGLLILFVVTAAYGLTKAALSN